MEGRKIRIGEIWTAIFRGTYDEVTAVDSQVLLIRIMKE
jgi:hypothetical protein